MSLHPYGRGWIERDPAKQRRLRALRDRLEDAMRVLMLPDLTAEERQEYAECVANLSDRIAEVEA